MREVGKVMTGMIVGRFWVQLMCCVRGVGGVDNRSCGRGDGERGWREVGKVVIVVLWT